MPTGTVHFVVPAGIDDPALVSGGNVYDRRLIDGLSSPPGTCARARSRSDPRRRSGCASRRCPTEAWCSSTASSRVASPGELENSASRLRLVILAHMVSASFPAADPRAIERRVPGAPCRPSRHRDEPVDTVRAPEPRAGSARADRRGGARSRRCRAGGGDTRRRGASVRRTSSRPHKGQDILVEALGALARAADLAVRDRRLDHRRSGFRRAA